MGSLTDFVPISTIMVPRKGVASLDEWYLQEGGLRKRLLVLGGIAGSMSQLHGKGLACSVPTPENILISKSTNAHHVRLIDQEDLQYESTPNAALFTPGYAAPELLAKTSGVNTLTDAFSFAVIAFQTLSLVHPFNGEMFEEGESGLREQAHAGILPWIDDPEDHSNSANIGIPRQRVLSPRLMDAFFRTFCPGRLDPTARPGVTEWADRLFGAADATIECPACSGTFYFNQRHCPWCDGSRPSFVAAVFRLWDPMCGSRGGMVARRRGEIMFPVSVGYGAISSGRPFVITRRLAFGQKSGSSSEPVVSATLSDRCVKLRCLDGNVYTRLRTMDNKITELDEREQAVHLEEGKGSSTLHFGHVDSLHRMVSFQLHEKE